MIMAQKQVKKVPAKTKQSTASVRVKTTSEVATTVSNLLAYNLHGRYNFHFSKQIQKRLVAYGPWLAAATIAVGLPELMVFAKDGNLMAFSGFFNSIFFNQQSWVIMLIMLANIMLLVDGISYLFEKKRRGWNRVYQASLLSGIYIAYQLLANISEPAPALLSLLGILFILFAVLDIRNYYK